MICDGSGAVQGADHRGTTVIISKIDVKVNSSGRPSGWLTLPTRRSVAARSHRVGTRLRPPYPTVAGRDSQPRTVEVGDRRAFAVSTSQVGNRASTSSSA